MISRAQSIAVVVMLGVAFVVGYSVADAKWEQEVTDAKLAYQTRVTEIENEYREKERKAAESFIAALDARDRARADLDVLRSSADRMRRERDEARRRLSASDTASCKRERERLAEGADLVGRSVDLLQRCVGVATESVTDKHLVVRMYQGK